MYELNLGFDNQSLYRKCEVTPAGNGRYSLDTPLDSTVIIVATELLELLEDIPDFERDCLVLTGAVPPALYMTAQSILGPFFDEVVHHDGKSGNRVKIPQPPEHFNEQD